MTAFLAITAFIILAAAVGFVVMTRRKPDVPDIAQVEDQTPGVESVEDTVEESTEESIEESIEYAPSPDLEAVKEEEEIEAAEYEDEEYAEEDGVCHDGIIACHDDIHILESPVNNYMVLGKLDESVQDYLLKKVRNLPPLPRAAMDLLPLLSNPRTNARDIARIVSADPLLAGKILRRVNSSYYGLNDKIDSIQHAIMLIGFDNIRSITLRESFDTMVETEPVEDLTANLLWTHSAAISLIAKHLAQKVHGVESGMVGSAGLLHDIGLLVLMAIERDKLTDALRLSATEHKPLSECEEELLGYNHQVLGELLALKWNLSNDLAKAIGRHHSPVLSSDNDINPVSALVWFAHSAAIQFGYGYRVVKYDEEASLDLAHELGLRLPIIDHITQGLLRDLQKATTLWEVPITEHGSSDIDPLESRAIGKL